MALLTHRWAQIAVLIASALYLAALADRGWIPHDEGLLGQSAERVLQGQLPHIDFDDPYTGGLAMLHAMSFKLFGIRLYSMRMMLYLFTLAFVWVTYQLAARIAKPWQAFLVTLLVVAWSVPNYFAALPSWYNLFFAVFGAWALIKYSESNRIRWLILAGVFGGLSFLIKLSGLFFVAAGVLFAVYHEQETAERKPGGRRSWLFLAFTSACLAVFVALLVLVIRRRLTPMDTIHFVVPGAAISLSLIYNEWLLGSSATLARFLRLIRTLAFFGAGIAVPILIFLIPYLLSGSLGLFIDGVFILPQKRIQWTDYPLPDPWSLWACVPLGAMMLAPLVIRLRWDHWLLASAVAVLCIGMVAVGREASMYGNIWNSTRPLVPLLTMATCLTMVAPNSLHVDASQRRLLFLMVCVTAMTSLVQFPYSFAIYFCYVAPLVIVSLTMLALSQQFAPRKLYLGVAVLYFGFAIVWLNQGSVRGIGVKFLPHGQDTAMDVARFGLKTSAAQAELYEQIIGEIHKHSDEAEAIYATADCPEIYFLAARSNPTRTFYDFFEADFEENPSARIQRIVQMLDQAKVNVVVFHWQAEFSGSPSSELANAIAANFPYVQHFFRDAQSKLTGAPTFSVAWRDRQSNR